MSLKFRLIFWFVAVVGVCVIGAVATSSQKGVSEAKSALIDAASHQLKSQLQLSKLSLEQYFDSIEKQVVLKASEKTVLQASKSFIAAYGSYVEERGVPTNDELKNVAGYYRNEFLTRYKERNNSGLDDIGKLYSNLPLTTVALQHDFISSTNYPVGEKDSLKDLPVMSAYADAHSEFHSYFRSFLYGFGYHDIFLVDAKNGDLVYSVFKELDFATNMLSGPYSETGIAQAFKGAIKLKQGETYFTSMAPYVPSYSAMAGFVGSPIYDNNELVSVIIFQIPLDRISSITTVNGKWGESGFGMTGEMYIVNTDRTMLTESRSVNENIGLAVNKVAALSPMVAESIRSSATAVGNVVINDGSSVSAFSGGQGTGSYTNYLGEDVYRAYTSLELGGHTYGLMADIGLEEIMEPGNALSKSVWEFGVIFVLIGLAIACAVSVFVASRIVNPINAFSTACSDLNSGDADLSVKLKKSNVKELNVAVDGFNLFLESVRTVVESMKDKAQSIASSSEELSATSNESMSLVERQKEQMSIAEVSVRELTEAVAEVAGRANESRSLSEMVEAGIGENVTRSATAQDQMTLLVSNINDTSKVIGELSDEVVEVNKILKVISDISEQTNLLALNAAIEAARAGDAGRGFSVVADEVRALANKTQNSASEISNLIQNMNRVANDAVSIMQKAEYSAGEGINVIAESSESMTYLKSRLTDMLGLVDTVASATEEQEAVLRSVNETIVNLSAGNEEVENGSKQVLDAASHLARLSEETASDVNRYRT